MTALFVFIVVVTLIASFYPMFRDYYTSAKKTINEGQIDDFNFGEPTYIYDNKNNLILKLSSDVENNYLEYDDIPKDVINAFISIEDQTFWPNKGFDVKGIARVLVNYAKSNGEEVHGASTITQQVIKNVYLTQDVNIDRKINEIFMAYFMTKKYSKKEIISFYVNDVYFGNSYYGIENAAKGYFGKSAKELTLAESTYLCAIPNNPTIYDPITNHKNTVKRQKQILKAMLKQEYITSEEYQLALQEKSIQEEIRIHYDKKSIKDYDDFMATYALDCSVKWLMQENGFELRYTYKDDDDYETYKKEYASAYDECKKELTTKGYHIYTSLDKKVQKNLQTIVNNKMKGISNSKTKGVYDMQASVTAIDNKSGKVIGIIGGRKQKSLSDYSFNRAFQSYRQPGSSIKPIAVYTPAIDEGYNAKSLLTCVDVVAARKKDARKMGGSRLSLEYSLQQSINGSAWWLLSSIGIENGLSHLTEMQFDNLCPSDYNVASSLGGLTYGTNTTQMAGAYCALANHGVYRETTCIYSIKDKDDNELYTDPYIIQTYSAKAADTIANVMKGVLISGTARGLNWYGSTKVEAACKTGTTNDNKDGWLCGFTNDFTVCVWVGYDVPKATWTLQGATYPASIWKDSMLYLLGTIKPKEKIDISHINDKSTAKTLVNDNETQSTIKEYVKRQKNYENFENAYNQLAMTDKQLYTYYSDVESNYKKAKSALSKIDEGDYTREWSVKLEDLYHQMSQ